MPVSCASANPPPFGRKRQRRRPSSFPANRKQRRTVSGGDGTAIAISASSSAQPDKEPILRLLTRQVASHILRGGARPFREFPRDPRCRIPVKRRAVQ